MSKTASWEDRHYAATQMPVGHEHWSTMMNGAVEYVAAYHKRYESNIADDYVLGPAFARILSGLRDLLDGELGRLDGGKCWDKLEAVAMGAGWESLEACIDATA